METLPYDNFNQLAEVLLALSSDDQNKQKQATKIMTDMVLQPTKFIDSMMALVLADTPITEETFKIKRAAIIHVPGFLSLCDELSLEDQTHIINVALNVLFSERVLFRLKRYIEQILLIFYSSDRRGELRKEGMTMAKEKLITGNINDCYGGLMVLHTVIESSSLTQSSMSPWFMLLLEGLVRSGETLVNGVIQEIRESMQEIDQTDRISNILIGTTVIKRWTEVIYQFVTILGKTGNRFDPKHMDLILGQESILQILTKLLKLYLPTKEQGDCNLLSLSGVPQIDEVLNAMKAKILMCFNFILDLMKKYESGENRVSDNPSTNAFYGFIQNLGAKYVLDHVFRFCKNTALDIEKVLSENNYLQECLYEALKFLTKLTYRAELGTLFFNCRGPLIMEICLPLIKSSQEEIIEFKEDPVQFVEIALDACQGQMQETTKAQAMQLIERMCEHVDGTVYFVSTVLLEVIKYCLISHERTEIPEKFPLLNDFIESAFITKTDSQIKVETCILVLSNVGYFIAARSDLKSKIEEMLSTYHQYFLGTEVTPLIQSRLCLFLGFYLIHIFKGNEQQQLFELYLGFLIQCAGLTNSSVQAVAEQACNTLCLLFNSKKKPSKRLTPYTNKILTDLISFIKDAKATQFFELIIQIVKSFEDEILKDNEIPFKILHALIDRAEAEYLLIKADREASLFTLDKVWNTIQSIIQLKDMILRYQDSIEKMLVPLFYHLENDTNFPYEDNILDYMAVVIKTRSEVTPLFWQLSKLFPRIFEKQKAELMHLFAPLNQLIIHGVQLFQNDLEALNMIINMFILGLNPKSPKANSASVSEAALMLQLAIQYLTIPDILWENILVACFNKLESLSDKNSRRFLKARIGGVFLIAFLTNFQLTQAIIVNRDASKLIDFLLENILAFETHSYDRKVFLIGFTNFFAQNDIHPSILQKLPQIFSIIIPFFKYVDIIEKRINNQIEYNKEANKTKGTNLPINIPSTDREFLREFLKDDILTIKAIIGTTQQTQRRNLFEDNGKMGVEEPKILDLDNYLQEEEEKEEEEDEDEEEGYDDAYDGFPIQLTSENIANRMLDTFETEFKKQDEFNFFYNVMKQLKTGNPMFFGELMASMPEYKRDFMEDILLNKRIELPEEGKLQARRIVKPKARKQPGA